MQKGRLQPPPSEDQAEERAEWIEAVDRIVAEAEAWGAKRGWWIERETKNVSDDDDRIGDYSVPMLRIQTGNARLVFEPIARYVVGGKGRLDLSVFPSYHNIAILRRDDGWWIAADNGGVAAPWSEKSFVRAAGRLAGKA